MQVDNSPSAFSQSTPNPAPVRNNNASSAVQRKGWGGEKALEKFIHQRQSTKMPSRFAKSTPTSSSLGLMPPVTSLHGRETSHQESSLESPEAVLSAVRTKGIVGQDSIDAVYPAPASPRRLSSYAERILGASPVGSPKLKKTGSETREEILNNLLSNSHPATPTGLTTPNVSTNIVEFTMHRI